MSPPDMARAPRFSLPRNLKSLRSWTLRLLCGALLTTPAGCFKATFIAEPAAGTAQAPTSGESFWQHEFLYGLVGSGELDVRDVCASRSVRIETGGNVLTTGVSLISAGLYTPRTIHVTCVKLEDAAGRPSREAQRPTVAQRGRQ